MIFAFSPLDPRPLQPPRFSRNTTHGPRIASERSETPLSKAGSGRCAKCATVFPYAHCGKERPLIVKVYIVEDDDDMRFILRRMLRRNFPGVETKESVTAEQALAEIPEFNPDVTLVDISLPGMDGIELIRRLKPKCNVICILVVTAHEVDVYRKSAMEAGAYDIISKMEDMKLIRSVRELFEKGRNGGCA
jgi:CheY-like chemotaxis protein